MEEGSELVQREVSEGGTLPMFTSCSPGWIKFVEQFYPELLPNLSTCKSPQQMMGAIIKSYFAEREGIDPGTSSACRSCPARPRSSRPSGRRCRSGDRRRGRRAHHPRAATADPDRRHRVRKPARRRISTRRSARPRGRRDLRRLRRRHGAALRTAYLPAHGADLEKVEFEDVRGMEGVKEAEITVGDRKIRLAVANRLANARQIAERVKQGDAPWDFIEVMACPAAAPAAGDSSSGTIPSGCRRGSPPSMHWRRPARCGCPTRTPRSPPCTRSISASPGLTRRTSSLVPATSRGRSKVAPIH